MRFRKLGIDAFGGRVELLRNPDSAASRVISLFRLGRGVFLSNRIDRIEKKLPENEQKFDSLVYYCQGNGFYLTKPTE